MTGTGQLVVRGLVPDMVLEFNVREFRLNSPSEHIIGGKTYDLELQIIHSVVSDYLPNDDSLSSSKLILSVLFSVKRGATNDFLDKLNLDTFDTITKVNLKEFIESMNQNYIYYQGSLSTPPCTENVYRFIMADVQYMSYEQLEKITAFYASNARTVQTLNSRSVVKVTKKMSRTLESAGEGLSAVLASVMTTIAVLFALL
ncbi:MAG: carbonic anhydrase family protein [Candidatus Pacebacteria bacterium]|nr:carbonic anhydrase family protein [Candidatus Paceibacterota bacterium]